VKEKAQYNLINALKSEHLKRKNWTCTVPVDEQQQQQECASSTIPTGESPDPGDESDVFQAERILDERINRDTSMKEYFIKWKGYDIKDSTWVPEVGVKKYIWFLLSLLTPVIFLISSSLCFFFSTGRETLLHRILCRFLQ
jgi:hypothetical protein